MISEQLTRTNISIDGVPPAYQIMAPSSPSVKASENLINAKRRDGAGRLAGAADADSDLRLNQFPPRPSSDVWLNHQRMQMHNTLLWPAAGLHFDLTVNYHLV